MEEEYNENKYKDIIKEALRNVTQELVIRIGDDHYLTYVHDVQFHDGKMHIDWSTPHEEEKEILFPHVQRALIAQFNFEEAKPWYIRFLDIFKRK
ncbi:head vertex assembly chaperone [Aeromonas phage ZPAH1]|nr:head vertex assembly chaperone [Aeromonas phage Aswh_1]QQG33966.1 head vertex assembly chaperone [Aeromonas phage ZPAH1]